MEQRLIIRLGGVIVVASGILIAKRVMPLGLDDAQTRTLLNLADGDDRG